MISAAAKSAARLRQLQRFVRQLAGAPTLGLPDGISFFNDRSPLELQTSCEHDMGCGGSRHMGGALIAQGHEIEAVEEMLARPQQHR